MDLLRALPYDGFRHLEAKLKGQRRIDLDMFVSAVTDTLNTFGVDRDGVTRRSILALFHNVDFSGNRVVSWEQLTSYMVDDSSRIMSATHEEFGSKGPSINELSTLDHVGMFKQPASGKTRLMKYVESWDRLIRVVHRSGSQDYAIEMMSTGSLDHVCKESKATMSPPTCIEACDDLNLIVAAHQDMSVTLHSAQVLREGPASTLMPLLRTLPMKDTEESTTSMLWHPINKVLYSGFRGGSVAPWVFRPDRINPLERYALLPRTEVFEQSISGMVPFEERLILASIESCANIALYDPTKETVVETLRGHSMGVQCMARVDNSDLVVTGGFERCPFLWIVKIRDFPPWKLIDKVEPHRGNIVQLFTPPFSSKIISLDDRGVSKLWDIRTMRCVQTLVGDVPPPAKNGNNSATVVTVPTSTSFFHTGAYHATTQTMLSCGPQHVHHFRGNVPECMDRTDDQSLTMLLYHPTHETFYTAHETSVKVWDQKSGAVVGQFAKLAPATISSMTLDNRGRKLFIGTENGDIHGYNIVTGVRFRTFKPLSGRVISLSYANLWNGTQLLLGVSPKEMIANEDHENHGREQIATHPMQHARLQILKTIADPEEAQRRIGALEFGGLMVQAKLSLCYVWMRWYMLVIDLPSLAVVQCLEVQGGDIIAVEPLGDFPAVAILDNRNILTIFAVRPSSSAGTQLARRDLNNAEDNTQDKRTRSLIHRMRKMSIHRHTEEKFVKSVVAEFVPHDESAPTGQRGCIMHFHQSKRIMYVSDSDGTLWEWLMDDFISCSNVRSVHYPLKSLMDQVYRAACSPLTQKEAMSAIRLVKGYRVHDDEVKFFLVVFHDSRTRIVTGGHDNRVRAWDINGTSLGELSQGRFLHPNTSGSPEVLQSVYARFGILPWTFSDAPPDNDIHIIADMPTRTLQLLHKIAARYRGRIHGFARSVNNLNRPGSADWSQSHPDGPNDELPPNAVTSVPPPAPDLAGIAPPTDDASVSQNRRHRGGKTILMQEGDENEASVSFAAFMRDCGLNTDVNESSIAQTDVSDPEEDKEHRMPFAPKAKFRIRGATVPRGQAERAQPVTSPRNTKPSVTKRGDLPLTSNGVASQHAAAEEDRERNFASAFHLNWDFYQRVVLHKGVQQGDGSAEGRTKMIDLSKRDEAIHMRCVYVPPIPTKPSLPMTGRQGRLPLTARDQERFAVKRLLGETTTAGALDDFYLPDSGVLR